VTLIESDLQAGVLLLTLNRPGQLNALNREVLSELDAWIDKAHSADDVRALVLTGAGDRAFCAGADIDGFIGLGEQDAYELMRYGQGVFDRLERLDRPTIAAVNGYALGGGCELALACDLRFAADTARFGQPEISLANLPGWGGTQRLPRLVGPARAKDLIFTGRFADAEEALSIGLADRVVPAPDMLPAALEYARGLAAKSPLAVALAKRAIHEGLELGRAAGLETEARAVARCFTTAEQQEAVRTFMAKRDAKARSGP
jgi:enoyl-CoA hydratase